MKVYPSALLASAAAGGALPLLCRGEEMHSAAAAVTGSVSGKQQRLASTGAAPRDLVDRDAAAHADVSRALLSVLPAECDCSTNAILSIVEEQRKALKTVPLTMMGLLDDHKDLLWEEVRGSWYPVREYGRAAETIGDLVVHATEILQFINCGHCDDAEYPYEGISHDECCCDVGYIKSIVVERMYDIARIANLNPGASDFTCPALEALLETAKCTLNDLVRPYGWNATATSTTTEVPPATTTMEVSTSTEPEGGQTTTTEGPKSCSSDDECHKVQATCFQCECMALHVTDWGPIRCKRLCPAAPMPSSCDDYGEAYCDVDGEAVCKLRLKSPEESSSTTSSSSATTTEEPEGPPEEPEKKSCSSDAECRKAEATCSDCECVALHVDTVGSGPDRCKKSCPPVELVPSECDSYGEAYCDVDGEEKVCKLRPMGLPEAPSSTTTSSGTTPEAGTTEASVTSTTTEETSEGPTGSPPTDSPPGGGSSTPPPPEEPETSPAGPTEPTATEEPPSTTEEPEEPGSSTTSTTTTTTNSDSDSEEEEEDTTETPPETPEGPTDSPPTGGGSTEPPEDSTVPTEPTEPSAPEEPSEPVEGGSTTTPPPGEPGERQPPENGTLNPPVLPTKPPPLPTPPKCPIIDIECIVPMPPTVPELSPGGVCIKDEDDKTEEMTKPSSITLTYVPAKCDSSSNSQGDKTTCEDTSGSSSLPDNARVVLLDKTGEIELDCFDISEGEDFTISYSGDVTTAEGGGDGTGTEAHDIAAASGSGSGNSGSGQEEERKAADGGGSGSGGGNDDAEKRDDDDEGKCSNRLPSETILRVHDINDSSLSTILQEVNIHTSCSAPLVLNERFGSFVNVGMVACGGGGGDAPGAPQPRPPMTKDCNAIPLYSPSPPLETPPPPSGEFDKEYCKEFKPFRIMTFSYAYENCDSFAQEVGKGSCTLGPAAGQAIDISKTVLWNGKTNKETGEKEEEGAKLELTGSTATDFTIEFDDDDTDSIKNQIVFELKNTAGELIQVIDVHISCSSEVFDVNLGSLRLQQVTGGNPEKTTTTWSRNGGRNRNLNLSDGGSGRRTEQQGSGSSSSSTMMDLLFTYTVRNPNPYPITATDIVHHYTRPCAPPSTAPGPNGETPNAPGSADAVNVAGSFLAAGDGETVSLTQTIAIDTAIPGPMKSRVTIGSIQTADMGTKDCSLVSVGEYTAGVVSLAVGGMSVEEDATLISGGGEMNECDGMAP